MHLSAFHSSTHAHGTVPGEAPAHQEHDGQAFHHLWIDSARALDVWTRLGQKRVPIWGSFIRAVIVAML